MLRLPRFASLRRPHGLAARAVLFTTLLVAATAAISAAIVLIGAHREGERQELAITHDLTEHFAARPGDVMARGNTRVLSYMIQGTVQRNSVRALSVRDAQNQILAQEGGDSRDNATMTRLAQRALAERRSSYERLQDGGLAVASLRFPFPARWRLGRVVLRCTGRRLVHQLGRQLSLLRGGLGRWRFNAISVQHQ